MSIVPKVTAHAETSALWHFLEGDAVRLTRTLQGMSQTELMAYRSQLRELARSVDGEIHRKYATTTTEPKDH
jgi:hypothetical protein